jgi:hypothetical protein
MINQNRRNFLKTSAVGAAGLVAASSGVDKVFANTTAVGFVKGAEINPNISNFRVVYITDPAMLDGGTNANYGNLNSGSGKAKIDIIKKNMDKMACALANKVDPTDAWKTIFQKPDAKEWKDVTVAIKVNMLGDFQPLKPTLSAFCDALNVVGINLANITVYDATKDACNGAYGGFKNPVKTSNGENNRWPSSMGYQADGIVKNKDILISFVTNKNHKDWGWYTLNMKNHTGTINKNWNSGNLCPPDDLTLVKINQCDAIMGNPGPGVPHKQQLVFIDSLFGSKNGSWGGGADCAPCMLMMGTLAPVVDWACVKNVRKALLGVGDENRMKKMFTDFGFTDADADLVIKPAGKVDAKVGGWVDAAKFEPSVAIKHQATEGLRNTNRSIELAVNGSGFSAASTRIALKHNSSITSVVINNMQGKLIRTLELTGNGDRVVWDGLNNAGRSVRSGTYVAAIHSGSSVATGKITLSR